MSDIEFDSDHDDLGDSHEPDIAPEIECLLPTHATQDVAGEDVDETSRLEPKPIVLPNISASSLNSSPSVTLDSRDARIKLIPVKTLPKAAQYLTKYEFFTCIGTRATMLSKGYPPQVETYPNIDTHISIARREILERKIPFILARKNPDHTYYYVRLRDLKINIK
jgi:DNA-directed RNA polymerase subunit K/omega